MSVKTKPQARNSADTKARILAAAQAAFAERGYSQTGLREIAAQADVATSLVVKYYGTKASLFRTALVDALVPPGSVGKAKLGARLVKEVANPKANIVAPAMIALSLGDEDARAVASEVLREHVIAPWAQWLGLPDARARAASVLMLSIGFAIFTRHLDLELPKNARDLSADWAANTLQALLDDGLRT